MGLHLNLTDAPGGLPIADLTRHLDELTISTNEHGFESLQARAPRGLLESFRLLDSVGPPDARLADRDASLIWEGRVEDRRLLSDGFGVGAFGYSRALGAIPYTALWSASGTEGWRESTAADFANRTPEKFSIDFTNRLFIGLEKNATYTNAGDTGEVIFQTPALSARTIVGLAMDIEYNLPANWKVEAYSITSGGAFNLISSVTSPGPGVNGNSGARICTAGVAVVLSVYQVTGAPYNYLGETGASYVKATNVRVVSSTTNMINTSFTVARAAGVNVTATVGSTARMYVGQRLYLRTGFASESVIVLSIGSSTQFNATFTNAYIIGDPIESFIVYADEIVKDVLSVAQGLNTTQLATTTALIQSPGIDLLHESYEDRSMVDILDYLCSVGDSATPPRLWEWGVWERRELHFWPRATNARTWYADVSEVEIERTLAQMTNSVYATYQDANDRTLRTVVSEDTLSLSRNGVRQRQAVDTSGTSSVQAIITRDALLNDLKDPIPRVKIVITAIRDGAGARYPGYAARAGDTIIIRNLPPAISSTIDRIRSFRISRTDYDVMADTLEVEPESPIPSLQSMLALAARVIDAPVNSDKSKIITKRKGL